MELADNPNIDMDKWVKVAMLLIFILAILLSW